MSKFFFSFVWLGKTGRLIQRTKKSCFRYVKIFVRFHMITKKHDPQGVSPKANSFVPLNYNTIIPTLVVVSVTLIFPVWCFPGGFALLPFLWAINSIWFFKEAFMKEHYEEQAQIKKCKSCVTLGLAYNEFGYNEHPASIHWVPLTLSSVTTSTWLQHTGSRLQRVLLQRAPVYNEQISLH